VSAESETLYEPRRRTAGTVAGYLSAVAVFTSLVGIAWHPLRLILPALAIALVASGMAGREQRLQFGALMISTVCLFLGLAVAVVTSHPLW
jgi:tetrahydromethanopterin S-methyltransferase subunit F